MGGSGTTGLGARPLSAGAPRICLALTLGREVDTLIALRWFELMRKSHWPGPVVNGRAAYTVQSRNNCLTQAFRALDQWDALFFWDSDQLPPERIPGPIPWLRWQGGYFTEYLTHCARQRQKKVTVFLYLSREDDWEFADGRHFLTRSEAMAHHKATGVGLIHGPHEPVAYMRQDDGGYRYLTLEELHPMLVRRGQYPIGGGGTGAMLIQKDVLVRLAELKGTERVFEAPVIEPGHVGGLRGTQWTEDLYFCEEVSQKLADQVWLDTAGESGHQRTHLVTSKEYLQARGIG